MTEVQTVSTELTEYVRSKTFECSQRSKASTRLARAAPSYERFSSSCSEIVLTRLPQDYHSNSSPVNSQHYGSPDLQH